MIRAIVVEDSAVVREFLTYILSSAPDIEVSGTAGNGEEALDAVKRYKPDVIAMDIHMPKMDGFAVCKELQDPRWSKYRQVPILVLTPVREEASRRRYELETGLELDVDDYVEKPMAPDILIERVQRLVKNRK